MTESERKAAEYEFDRGVRVGVACAISALRKQAQLLRDLAKRAWHENQTPEAMQRDAAVDSITRHLEALVSLSMMEGDADETD